jgi:cell division transport system permease protein
MEKQEKKDQSSVSFWQRFRRTPYQSFATLIMMFVSLTVTGIFLVLVAGSTGILSYFESKPQLTIFLKDGKDKVSVDQLVESLRVTGKLASTQYVSKEQALAIYREQNKNDPLLLEMVTADILPASLDVSATQPQFLSELADTARKDPLVDEIVFQKDVVDTLISWTSTIRRVGIILVGFLLSSTCFILLTGIGMRIAYRRDEIEILRLVGATSWYIKRPFVTEGLAYGFVGALMATCVVSGVFLYLQPYLTSFLRGIPTLVLFHISTFTMNIWPPSLLAFLLLWVLITVCGLVIGLLGSLIAVSRFMR